MKKSVAIFVFVAILLQALNQVVIVGQYYANKDYIAKNLCENRSKPSLHCNGKCYLKKKLAKEGKEQAPNPRHQKSEQDINLFCSNARIELPRCVSVELRIKYFIQNDLGTSSFHHSVFRPPSA